MIAKLAGVVEQIEPDAAVIDCKERPAFEHLPAEQARDAKNDIGNALDQRHGDRCLGRQPEEGANCDETAFLSAERAGDGEGRAPNRLQEALDDQGFGIARREPHRDQNEQDFEGAEQPDR